ncbi:LOW QUALITY PROTEIN: cartilage intermediate layer protein 2-like [Cyprinodon tularosa]|uniref:LOW QUALITY PROTEIN: cartilage intermediate layer protein 2-like n=1 Tax=Cyprinodon tularosa TaxID=77115 RepID=UPI0018E23DD5|nr:LOW QUALITY PROTEIN: cartilage intermediate layer protein 2-like [Cyprinodon tularosa]
MNRLVSVLIVAGLIFESWAQRPEIVLSGLQCYPAFNLQCWTQWFDSDNPSSNGDRENLNRLLRKYPGKICPNPLSGLTPEEAGDIIKVSDTNTGFICRKKDQPDGYCEDYKVRFSCPPPYCAETVCWTKWYDRDNPSGSGDWETLRSLQNEYKGEICNTPHYIEAVTTDTLTPAIYTGENFYAYNPTVGFVCRQEDQKDRTCKDYKVRFGCPCDN